MTPLDRSVGPTCTYLAMVFAVSELQADAEKGRMHSLLARRLAAQDARFPRDKPDRTSISGNIQLLRVYRMHQGHTDCFLGTSRRAGELGRSSAVHGHAQKLDFRSSRRHGPARFHLLPSS